MFFLLVLLHVDEECGLFFPGSLVYSEKRLSIFSSLQQLITCPSFSLQGGIEGEPRFHRYQVILFPLQQCEDSCAHCSLPPAAEESVEFGKMLEQHHAHLLKSA